MATPIEPPPFQEAARCDVCNRSFNTFRRRHHCRCCGRTLCYEHSSDQMALPQFGIFSNVRVCSDCFNKSTRSGREDPPASVNAVAAATDKLSKLNVGSDIDVKSDMTARNTVVAPECKCRMPLCICEAPQPDPPPAQKAFISVQPSSRAKKNVISQQTSNAPSSSNAKSSVFFNLGQTSDNGMNKPHTQYEANGEGLREAIKNDDATAVKKLLSDGVDANYCDKQGFALLHLAALFNRTEIALILMDHGATLDSKNAQGETPLDCAPTMLQHKMRQKMDEVS